MFGLENIFGGGLGGGLGGLGGLFGGQGPGGLGGMIGGQGTGAGGMFGGPLSGIFGGQGSQGGGLMDWFKNLGSNPGTNFQNTGMSAGDVAAVSPNPTQAVSAYNAAGGDPVTGAATPVPIAGPNDPKAFPSGNSPFSKMNLASGLAGMGKEMMKQPDMSVPPIRPPNYGGGSGSTLKPGAGPINGQALSQANPMMAFQNPLLEMMMKRLSGGRG